MHARDATGRQVSLLNDDSCSFAPKRPLMFQCSSNYSSHSYPTPEGSPETPELLRSNSYDSQMSNDPISPITPALDYYSRPTAYPIHEYGLETAHAKRPSYAQSSRSASFDDEGTNPTADLPLPDRPGKRYPCRYRDTHGCEKTFTTSGHASRHSKIHTAEKAVQCTFLGCQKKFTRADNMKQHLETHYKDKSRSSSSASRPPKTIIAETRRNSAVRRSSASGRSASRGVKSQWETEQYPLPTTSMHSPNPSSGTWDMRGLNLPLLNRPFAGRSPSGLDTLAAIACQDGA